VHFCKEFEKEKVFITFLTCKFVSYMQTWGDRQS